MLSQEDATVAQRRRAAKKSRAKSAKTSLRTLRKEIKDLETYLQMERSEFEEHYSDLRIWLVEACVQKQR